MINFNEPYHNYSTLQSDVSRFVASCGSSKVKFLFLFLTCSQDIYVCCNGIPRSLRKSYPFFLVVLQVWSDYAAIVLALNLDG